MEAVSEPTDLTPLPTAPWDERPAELPLDVEECRTALWRTRGNISDAAAMLKIKPQRLRAFVKKSDYLSRELEEAKENLKDIAEGNVYEALTDDQDPGRKDSMTRFVLASIGKDRGWGSGVGGPKTNINLGAGKFSITWEDGSSLSASSEPPDDDEMIDVTPNKAVG
jgi:hypothetical protein